MWYTLRRAFTDRVLIGAWESDVVTNLGLQVRCKARPAWERMRSESTFYYKCPNRKRGYVVSFAFVIDDPQEVRGRGLFLPRLSLSTRAAPFCRDRSAFSRIGFLPPHRLVPSCVPARTSLHVAGGMHELPPLYFRLRGALSIGALSASAL